MRVTTDWKDYEILDTSGGEKLERWKEYLLIRPDPQIIWNTPHTDPLWKKAHARYHRSSTGGGKWEEYKRKPEEWQVSYKGLRFHIRPTGFKHTGLFPEQAVNWDFFAGKNPKRGPGSQRAQPLCLYWGCDARLRAGRRKGLPCGCLQGHGTVGKRKRRAVRAGRASDPMDCG